jgi:hypothetical protein
MFGNISFEGTSASSGSAGFEPVTPGIYKSFITNVEQRTNDKGWVGASFEFTIDGGQYDARKVWQSFTLALPGHDDGEKIAADGKANMMGVLAASGHKDPGNPDSEPINGKAVGIKVGIKKNKRSGDMENVVVSWRPAGETPDNAAKVAGVARPAAGGWLSQAATTPDANAPLDDEIPF